MSGNSQVRNSNGSADVLRWPERIVTAEGLRRSLNGEHHLAITPGTVITPLAADLLKENGVSVIREGASAKPQATDARKSKAGWSYLIERPDSMVRNVIQALKREGMDFTESAITPSAPGASEECQTLACGLARQAAETVASHECQAAVIFCIDPGLTCCIANKVKGIRAVAVGSPAQAQRAVKGIGANVLVLELGKGTFFEIRQILRNLCTALPGCSDVVAKVIQELEGPCHCQSEAHGQPSVSLRRKCECGGHHAHR